MSNAIQLTAQTDDTLTFALSGEIDASLYEQFEATISGHYARDKRNIVLDCSQLSFIDSTILGGIVKIFKQLRADGKKLTIKHLSPRIRKLFEICALDKLLELEQ